MKIHSKIFAAGLVLTLSTGGSFLFAQQSTAPAPRVYRPAATAQVATPRPATSTAPAGSGARRGSAADLAPPNLRRAYIALSEAKRALDDAAPDKGGFREKALQSVEQAIKDVGAAVEYARTHPEETHTNTTTTTRDTSGGRGVTASGGISK